MVDGIIFDFDGTLFDSMGIWESVAPRLLKFLGKESLDEVNKEVRNMSLPQSCQYLKEQYGLDFTPDHLKDHICKIVHDYYMNEVEPKENVAELLSQISDRNIPMIIVTANERYLVEECLKKYNLDHYFCDIITCGDAGLNKDNPEIYKKSIELLNINSDNVAFFDDSHYAIKAANDVDLITIGVYDEFESMGDELKSISDLYINDFNHTELIWDFLEQY